MQIPNTLGFNKLTEGKTLGGKEMTRKQFEKLIDELEEALYWEAEDVHQCSYVEFREGFPISRTYERTLAVNKNIIISFDVEENEVQLFDTASDITGDWLYSWNMKEYSKMEVAIKIYKLIERIK